LHAQSHSTQLFRELIHLNAMCNRIAKLFASAAFHYGFRYFRGQSPPGRCVVVNYHSIRAESRRLFKSQLDVLESFASPLQVGSNHELEGGRYYFGVTVDDVFESFIVNGLPELCARQIPVTLFPPTGYLGRISNWTDLGGPNVVGEQVASAARLKALASLGHISFGSHSVTHRDLTRLVEGELVEELSRSKAVLEEITGRSIVTLSFPYGRFGERELRLARECGYKYYFTSTPQSIYTEYKEGVIGRLDVQPEDWRIEFKLKALGAYGWINAASVWKRRFKNATMHIIAKHRLAHG
jgi:peptidoglycan/xylan/chitin deacetylase (PgdA/CDA1 family)